MQENLPYAIRADILSNLFMGGFIMAFAGANVALIYASKYKDVHIVVNISGRFNLLGGIEGRLGKNFMQRIKRDGFIDVKDKRG